MLLHFHDLILLVVLRFFLVVHSRLDSFGSGIAIGLIQYWSVFAVLLLIFSWWHRCCLRACYNVIAVIFGCGHHCHCHFNLGGTIICPDIVYSFPFIDWANLSVYRYCTFFECHGEIILCPHLPMVSN